jgi:multidrug efflux system outer membrane protein
MMGRGQQSTMLRAARIATSCAALLAGCTVGPDYRRPDVELPAAWPVSASDATADARWWTLYADVQLNLMVEEALAHNSNLRLAAARVDEARAGLTLARADSLPNVSADATAARSRISERSGNFFPGIPTEFNDLTVKLDASWEIDFWGRYRRANEAARGDLLASTAARDAVQLSLISDVVRGYFTLQALDAQIAITKRTIETRRESLRLQRLRYNAGEASQFDLRQVEAEAAVAEALLPSLEQQQVQQENALSVLLGRSPRALMETSLERGKALEAMVLPPAVPAGLPSELLQRRPDIRQAEQQLIAANARIGVARAAYYPSLSLTGMFGFESEKLADLFSAPARIWQFGAGAAQTVFDAGRIGAQVDIAQARREQQLATYQGTVQNAFREVKDALVASRKSDERLTAEQARVKALRDGFRLADLSYRSGESSLLELLDAERGLLDAELNEVQAQRDRLAATADLFKALGGGWDNAMQPAVVTR